MTQRAAPQQLRDQILLSLQARSAPSVTHLAEELGAHRSSVSRTVNALISAGFVARDGRSLVLTEDGRGMAQSVLDSIPSKTRESTAKIQRLAERNDKLVRIATQQNPMMIEAARMQAFIDRFVFPANTIQDLATRQLRLLSSSVVKDIVVPTTTVFSTDDWVRARLQISQLAEQSTSSLGPMVEALSTSEIIQAALKGLADVQLVHTGWQENAALVSPFLPQVSDLLAQNSAIVSQMMSDFASIAAARPTGVLDIVSRSVAETVRSYQNYIGDVPEIFIADGPAIAFSGVSRAIYLPTAATSFLVGATRELVEVDDSHNDKDAILRIPQAEGRKHADLLDPYLDQLPPRFQQQWQGAWYSLRSDSPDRIRQSAHSARELIGQMLHHLAPDSCFTSEDIERLGHADTNGTKRPTRRMRVRYYLQGNSRSTADLAESLAKSLDELYDFFSKEAHSRADDQSSVEAMSALLISLGGWVAFVLSFQERNDDNPQ